MTARTSEGYLKHIVDIYIRDISISCKNLIKMSKPNKHNSTQITMFRT